MQNHKSLSQPTLFTIFAMCIASGLVALIWIAFPSLSLRLNEGRAASREGFVKRSFITEDASIHSYRVFVPHNRSKDEKLPVFLFLNGFGENGQGAVRQLANNFGNQIWELKGRFPFLAVASQCSLHGSWTAESDDTRLALQSLHDAIKKYNGDPNHVYLTGPSSGGAGVFNVAGGHPELFAAIVPISATRPATSIDNLANTFEINSLPIWSFYNERDNVPGVVEFNEQMRLALVRKGCSPIVSVLDRDGHDTWNHAYRNPALYDWTLRQSLDKHKGSDRFALLANDGKMDLQSIGKGNWSVNDRDLLSFEPPSDGFTNHDRLDAPTLLWRPTSNDFDFHFDYRSDRQAPLHVILLTNLDNQPRSGYEIHIVPSNQGSGEIRTYGDQKLLASLDCIAQQVFLPMHWSHFRLTVNDRQLLLRINEWILLECELPSYPLQIGFLGNDGSQHWRGILGRERQKGGKGSEMNAIQLGDVE
ncbi:MAG: hypothetical protein SGI77_10605 [Pirellulaceae bacterium]|nr:hypothetical protein [Pirellulaceae bacterium]